MIDSALGADIDMIALLARPAVRVLAVRLPLAPSTNDLTENTSKHKGRHTSPEVTRYKGQARRVIGKAIKAQDFVHLAGAEYRLTLFNVFGSGRAIKSRDADNLIKASQDIIAAVCEFNDKSIFDVRSIKAGVDPFESYTIAVLERFNG
jgi:Holliday junction resolvase RusA-like endonuclease